MADVLQSAVSEAESTHSGDTNWEEKLNLVFPCPESGSYLIEWFAEFTNTSTTNATEMRIRLDDLEEIGFSSLEPEDSGYYESSSGFAIRTLDAGSRRVDIDYRTTNSLDTAKIRKSRIMLRRID